MHKVCIIEPMYLSYDWYGNSTPVLSDAWTAADAAHSFWVSWRRNFYHFFFQEHAFFWNQLWSNNIAIAISFNLTLEKNQKDTCPSFDCKHEGSPLFNKNMLVYFLFWHPAPDKQNSTSDKFFRAQTLLGVQIYFSNTFWNSLELISISNTFYKWHLHESTFKRTSIIKKNWVLPNPESQC